MKKRLFVLFSMVLTLSLSSIIVLAYTDAYDEYFVTAENVLVEPIYLPAVPIEDNGGAESRLTVNRQFTLNRNSWTNIGSDSNWGQRSIFIENRTGNIGNVRFEVRDRNNNLIAFNHNVQPGWGIPVTIDGRIGFGTTFFVEAQAVSVEGRYSIAVSRQ